MSNMDCLGILPSQKLMVMLLYTWKTRVYSLEFYFQEKNFSHPIDRIEVPCYTLFENHLLESLMKVVFLLSKN